MSDRRMRIELVADVNLDDDDIEHVVSQAIVEAFLAMVDEHQILSFEEPTVKVERL